MVFCLLLVSALTAAVLAEVSPGFKGCLGHFYGGKPPVGFETFSTQLTPICQMQKDYNNPFFASLYHTKNRSPLYSAYILDARSDDITDPNETFQLEPQLVNTGLPRYMMLQPALKTEIRDHRIPGDPAELIKQSQAINSDYEGSSYDRGHLNPNADHPVGPRRDATYTLTNVAPMNPSLNRVAWKNNEKRVRDIATTCSKMYVITGVIPGNNWIIDKTNREKRVNIPSHIWSAFCCLGNNSEPIRAEGSWVRNIDDKVQFELRIARLQGELKAKLGVDIELFDNNCPVRMMSNQTKETMATSPEPESGSQKHEL